MPLPTKISLTITSTPLYHVVRMVFTRRLFMFISVCMRSPFLTFLLLLLYLTSCSQNDPHDFHNPRKIPIDGARWYQLNNVNSGLQELFDSKLHQKINTIQGSILKNYDAWYPLLDGEQMTIDSLEMFDWEGSNEDRPTTIYAILDNWKKVPIAVFTGARYNGWDGPDPDKPEVFALSKPVSGIRYLVINTWGDFPGEIEFYGAYTPPKPISPLVRKYVPLSNYFGINAFEWDFEGAPNPSVIDPQKLPAIYNFKGFRHYMDWEKLEPREGTYTFNPTEYGAWNYDTIYQWCKSNGIEVLGCLKTQPPWLQATYPQDKRGSENAPVKYGADFSDPASYIEQARAAFQYTARYGRNTAIDYHMLPLAPSNRIRIGLGLVRYIECDNERDKWWKGRSAYQTGREYAANLSAFYDGNKNTLGPGVGVKNADPTMQVVMAGLARPSTDYVRGMIDWSLEHRGRRSDGKPDLPWDVINYHYYCNDADIAPNQQPTSGRAPELTKAAAVAEEFIQMSHQYAGDMPVWVTETGYDINQESPQKALPINGRSAIETQADWNLRTSLLYARAGIQKTFFYELTDDNPLYGGIYSSCGFIKPTRTTRPAADYFYQTNKLFGAYTYAATISKDPIVDHYTNNGLSMYVLLVPDQKGRTTTYTLDLGKVETAYIYKPKSEAVNLEVTKQKTTNGKVTITVTETPVFVTGYDCITIPGKK